MPCSSRVSDVGAREPLRDVGSVGRHHAFRATTDRPRAGGSDVPDLYGKHEDQFDVGRMRERQRRAKEAIGEFERTFPQRLRSWRRKARLMERARRDPCPDCGEKLTPRNGAAFCRKCGLKRYAKRGFPMERRAETPQSPDPRAVGAP